MTLGLFLYTASVGSDSVSLKRSSVMMMRGRFVVCDVVHLRIREEAEAWCVVWLVIGCVDGGEDSKRCPY